MAKITSTVDYKAKYKELRARHTKLRNALHFWINSEFYWHFMKDVKTYPGREEWRDEVHKLMRKGVTGQHLLDALGGELPRQYTIDGKELPL